AEADLDRRGDDPARGQRHRPLHRLHGAAVQLLHEIGDGVGDEVDDLQPHRLALGDRHRLAHGLLAPLGVAAALDGDRPNERGGVVLHLAHALLVDAAAEGDRMRGADVGGGGHGRNVSGHCDEHAGGGGARARGSHPDDDGDLGVEQALADRPHRTLESARRVELDDEGLRPAGLRTRDGALHETERDRADHAVDDDGGHWRRRRRDRRGGEQGERDEDGGARQAPAHRPRARTLTSSNMRFAASSEVIWPGPSYGGETSTTSAPTSDWPTSARTSVSASYDVRPPTSGVPAAGADAGPTASMSNEQ